MYELTQACVDGGILEDGFNRRLDSVWSPAKLSARLGRVVKHKNCIHSD
jgi:hypothetical protein